MLSGAVSGDSVSDAAADFGGVFGNVAVGIGATFAIAATLNLSTVSENKVVFITIGEAHASQRGPGAWLCVHS